MSMKQIVQNMKNGKMSLLDVPAPKVGRGEVLVATQSSLISAGTEKMLIDFAGKSMLSKAQERPDLVKKVIDKVQRDGLKATASAVFSQLEQPLPLGYSAAGEVIAVGNDLKELYNVGDKVAMAGAGIANHAEVNAVPKNLLAKMPEGLSFEEASFATVTAIAMQGFRNSGATLGDKVLIMGLGLVGQLTAQIAKAAGCKVFAMDYDANRVQLAEDNGADRVHLMSAGGADSLVARFTKGQGFDSIIICAATESNAPVNQAAAWARDKATVVMTGKVGTELSYTDFMKKELNFVISRSYGPGRYDNNYEQKGMDYPIGYVRWTERENLEEALYLMATQKINVKSLISHSFPIEEMSDAYALVLGKEIPCMGVTLSYPRQIEERLQPRIPLRPVEVVTGKVGVSFMGAGSFSRAVLLPLLQKCEDVDLAGILSRGGVSAKTTGDKFGFAFAAGSEKEILSSEMTQAVFVTTRHDTHARITTEALNAGKHVFVEKPLAMNEEELNTITETHSRAGKILMVGYNRRFAPFVMALKDHFKDISAPRQVMIRVNAGQLDSGNWQNDPESGGGRLLGEACHFIDLALHLVGQDVKEVFASAGEGQDVYAMNIRFVDGSIAQILYTSEGDTSYSKEYIEMFAGGSVGVIDNFRKAYVVSGGKKRQFKLKGGLLSTPQDKGHQNELLAFMSAVKGETDNPMPMADLYRTSMITFAMEESMQTGAPVHLG